MSAEEKLKALRPFTLTVKPTAYAGPENTLELYDVPLPQIVAVVEAAEKFLDLDGGYIDSPYLDAFVAALAALDKALS